MIFPCFQRLSPNVSKTFLNKINFQLLKQNVILVNCVCPPDWMQFTVSNTKSEPVARYADCYWSDGSETYASFANMLSCKGGKLISLPNQMNLDFMTDQFLPRNYPLKGKKKIMTGLHKSDGTWKWWGYNNTEYPYAGFPQMAQPAPEDTFGYMWNYYGFKWNLTTAPDEAMQLICQRKACDADFVCDARQSK